jgi:hypothetical protein
MPPMRNEAFGTYSLLGMTIVMVAIAWVALF